MKKRLITILVLALAMVLALTGCEFIEDLFGKEPPAPAGDYVVYFISNGGTHVSAQDVKGGGLVTRPEDPTRAGYTFENWYKDAELTTLWNFETDTVSQNTMLYAKWTENPHACESKCEECGKCLDTECTEAVCADKCQGHTPPHACESVCEVCGKCTDSECTEAVCAEKCEGHESAVTTTITLEPTEGTPFQGPQTLRIGNFEIILSSEKSRIESKSATFELADGSFVTKGFRINFNGSETIYDAESGEWQNAIMFVTSGKGSVTIYWQHGGKGSTGDTSSKAYRNVALWNDAGEMLAKTEGQYDYEAFIVTTFEFDAAGTYYVGNLAGANNFFYVEVSYNGELVELPELAKYSVHFATGEGSAIDSIEVAENGTIEKPADPTRDGYEFGGWYKDAECTTPWNFTADKVTEETTLYAKWEEAYTGEYEEVTYSLNISDLETGTRSADEINGKFTIVSGSEVRNRTKTYDGVEYTKSVKIGNSTTKILVAVPGTGKLSFLVQNGSSGAATQFISVTAPDGTVHNIEFAGADDGSPVVMIELDVTEGLWTISRGKNGGTQDVFALSLTCLVEVSPEVGFELVAPGKVDYVAGEELDLSKLVLNATFESGKTEPLALADVTVDSSAFNKDAEGTYTITISYKEYAPITYTVSVYVPVEVNLDFDAVEKLAQNSAAGNGVYFNHSFKEVYAIGEELDLAGLSVTVVARCGEATKSFRVEDYEITGFDSTEGGEKVLTVTYGNVSANVSVYVAYTEPVADEFGVVNALVDPAYLGIIGDLSGPYHVFTTIQQALDFLAKVEPATQKTLSIAPGHYEEKLEITIPNLKIMGVGEKPEDVVIEWNSLYGLVDAGGFTHTTDSTQTVAVRDSATNVTIENVTISNYWNSQERMDAAGLAIERGLALLVQADRFIMKNSRLLGIQDTLELFTGRQYFEGVFISGYTDFIFGTNNTTYFKNCTIHVIDTIKDDQNTAGYITAFKGSNKGAADAIVYGAIFDGCKFTADEGVMAGKTAIGRTWGAYAAVAVINSELGGHISLDGYVSSENKNKRYISMNGIHPTDETVQFVEYNNTGAGAITEAVAGMRMLTAEEAALYADFATIFGTTNGKVSYLDPWDPASEEVVVDDREYYYFNGQEGTSGTSYTYTDNIQGATGTLGNITIDATKGKLTHRGSDSQFNAGAKIIFNVEAGTLVTVISYPGYGYYTINGIAHNANDTFSVYFAETTEVVIEATATSYLYQLIINPGEEAPEAPTMTEVKVNGMVVDYLVGDELSLDGVSVVAHYSDYSVRPLEYTVDTSAVDNTKPGEYTVVFTAGEHTINVTVVFVGDYTITESTTIDLSATGAKIEGTTGSYKELTIDATSGKFADNNGGWTQVNTGTIISFKYEGEVEVSVTAYSSADNFDIVTANGVCTITATGNDYLKAIIVKVKVVYGEDTTIDLSATGANIQKATGIYEGLEIDATNGKFADNNGGWVQVNTGTVIKLNVLEGATVSVSAYSSADNFDIVIANGVCTITAVGNDYLKAITVKYPVIFGEDTTIDLSATGANIQKATGVYEGLEIDATNGKFADNNGGWTQVNTGTVIKLNVLEGATVSVSAYSSADNFDIVIANGVCTITAVGNDYLKAINVSYYVDLTPEAGEYLKYDGNDCYTFDRENYLEEITFTYENVSTNTYQNVNAWIKDKAAGKATLDLYLVNNGTETVYVTVKLEAAGAVALAEEKVYVAAGEVKAVTLNFTGEAEMLYFFIDTGWSETTTSHAGSLTVAGVRFSGEAGSVTPPADAGLSLTFWTSDSSYTTNGNNIKYSGTGKTYACAGSDVSAHAAGKNTFTVTITNNGEATARVRIDIQGTTDVGNHKVLNTGATGGDVWTDMEWGGSAVTVAAGESVTLVITYDENTDRGAVTNLIVFADSARGDDATYSSDITLSGMAFN